MEIRICTENMIEFYSQFDYIDFKYELDKNSSSYLVDYRRLAEQEENNNQPEITAKNIWNLSGICVWELIIKGIREIIIEIILSTRSEMHI